MANSGTDAKVPANLLRQRATPFNLNGNRSQTRNELADGSQWQTVWAVFQGLLLEAIPFLLIGVAIATAARAWDPRGRWLQRLPRHPLLGPLSGAALGFALPACECGNVPVARRLLAQGAPMGASLGFLFCSTSAEPDRATEHVGGLSGSALATAAAALGSVVIALVLPLCCSNSVKPLCWPLICWKSGAWASPWLLPACWIDVAA